MSRGGFRGGDMVTCHHLFFKVRMLIYKSKLWFRSRFSLGCFFIKQIFLLNSFVIEIFIEILHSCITRSLNHPFICTKYCARFLCHNSFPVEDIATASNKYMTRKWFLNIPITYRKVFISPVCHHLLYTVEMLSPLVIYKSLTIPPGDK